MTSEKENKRMLNAIEGIKHWKQCVDCERTFTKGDICPWCKSNQWVYGVLFEDGYMSFEDEENENDTRKNN